MRATLFAGCVLVGLVESSMCRAGLPEPNTSSAFFQSTNPASPLAGQPFVLNVQSGACEFLGTLRTDATVVSLVGNVLTISISSTPDVACNQPLGSREYDIPALQVPGTYRIRVLVHYPDVTSPYAIAGGRDVVVVAGGVAQAAPLTIPSLGSWGAALLVMLMSSAAIWHRLKLKEWGQRRLSPVLRNALLYV